MIGAGLGFWSGGVAFDPEIQALIGGVFVGSNKWSGIALAGNGKLYCPPSDATQVL